MRKPKTSTPPSATSTSGGAANPPFANLANQHVPASTYDEDLLPLGGFSDRLTAERWSSFSRLERRAYNLAFGNAGEHYTVRTERQELQHLRELRRIILKLTGQS